ASTCGGPAPAGSRGLPPGPGSPGSAHPRGPRPPPPPPPAGDGAGPPRQPPGRRPPGRRSACRPTASGRPRPAHPPSPTPTRPSPRRDGATAYQTAATMHSALGRPDEALAAYAKARAIFESLAAANPAVAEYRSDVSRVHNAVGNAHYRAGRLPEARASYQAAL